MKNIKNIVKSQKLRHQLMRLGKFLPDGLMLSLQYRLLLGRSPNIKNPHRFTEWIQWYKINYRNPIMLDCVDKYTVRDYVSKVVGDYYLTKLYFKCNDASEIKFDLLPDKFVIKTTSGGSGDNVLIVQNKKILDTPEIISRVNQWKQKNYSDTSREWAYKKSAANPRIIIEELIEYDETKGLDDYKFFCFNGRCEFFKVDFNRFTQHQANYYDRHGVLLNVEEIPFKSNPNHMIVSLKELEKMIVIAEKLSRNFPFVRVDLYNENDRIYFGELTFYPGSGYIKFTPDSFDYEIGKHFSVK